MGRCPGNLKFSSDGLFSLCEAGAELKVRVKTGRSKEGGESVEVYQEHGRVNGRN